MKKILTIAVVALMTVSTQAVTMTWGPDAQCYIVDQNSHVATVYKNAGVNGAIGLFYLGNTLSEDPLKTVTDLKISDAVMATSSVLGTKPDNNDSTFKGQSYFIDISQVTKGDVYAVFFIDLDTGLLSNWYTSAALTSTYKNWYEFDGSEINESSVVVSGNNAGPSSAYVYVPIPEPASGALAFAGLAIMVCRRKKQK